jgi:maltokinase
VTKVEMSRIEATYQRLVHGTDLGARIRVHGDLHLAQVLRTRRGWVVIDFEGEPTHPIEDRRRPSSPLRDVAGMVRSFHYAGELALVEELERLHPEGRDDQDEVDGPRPIDPPERELMVLAEAWEERAINGFLHGYTSVDEVHRLLPSERLSRDALLTVYELDKAVYEVAYEMAHRPELASIPRAAVDRLSEPGHTERW